MPSKKKKYNSRFPPARIKKIMQTDEEIGKVAAAVPVLISKCLEMFLASLLTKAGEVTKSKRAKTMSRSHLKECIMTETMFDFLKDHVADIPDVQNDDEAGSSTFSMEKEPSKKIVRKRSSSKVKKTPKKRLKLGHSNNNESDDETDSAEDVSENGSGNEESDNMLSSSFSSPGLLSPTIKSKLDMQSASCSQHEDNMTNEKKPPIHIPLDVLLSGEELSTPAGLSEPLIIAETAEKKQDHVGILEKTENPSSSTQEIPVNPVNASSVRQGVIVKNTVAYPQSTTTAQSTKTKDIEGTGSKAETSAAADTTPQTNEIQPQPGSMLSFLYSSVSSPLPRISAATTVQQAPTLVRSEKYAYSPVTQHRLMEPNTGLRPSLLYPGLPPPLTSGQAPLPQAKHVHNNSTIIGGQENPFPTTAAAGFPAMPLSGYSYQHPAYNPTTTQRHYLGYSQSMLTPPSHHLAGVNAHIATHPSTLPLHQAKPKSRVKSDDDDYDA